MMTFYKYTARYKKIKLLKDIQKGIVNINEIRPLKFGATWLIGDANEDGNEMCKCIETGEVITRTELDKRNGP